MKGDYVVHKNEFKLRLSPNELRALVLSVQDSLVMLGKERTEALPIPFQAAHERWLKERQALVEVLLPLSEEGAA